MNTQLKIATWNVDRPNLTRKKERVQPIIDELINHSADILILTETNDCIAPGGNYFECSSLPLEPERDGYPYEKGERRVSIYSRYAIEKRLEVTNPYTTACAVFRTPHGLLTVYGCIIGILGNRDGGFDVDLDQQMHDLSLLEKEGHRLCYAGDFNVTFCDKYYPHEKGKVLLEEFFSKKKVDLLTRDIPENVDHIAISESFGPYTSRLPEWECWNKDKKLSDHKGVIVTLQFKNVG